MTHALRPILIWKHIECQGERREQHTRQLDMQTKYTRQNLIVNFFKGIPNIPTLLVTVRLYTYTPRNSETVYLYSW